MRNCFIPIAICFVSLYALTGCKSAYYGTWEKLGYEKRDILAERVEEASDDQKEAKKQFKDALAQFQSVVKVDGGELESKYKKLKGELEDSEDIAASVKKRIKSVESVAADLFAEWKKELDQYNDAGLRRSSEQQLAETRAQYSRLVTAMKSAGSKMEPVLKVFRDQVLFLKHNLNARAIASLRNTVVELETDVAALIRDMDKSIAEADAFIKGLE